MIAPIASFVAQSTNYPRPVGTVVPGQLVQDPALERAHGLLVDGARDQLAARVMTTNASCSHFSFLQVSHLWQMDDLKVMCRSFGRIMLNSCLPVQYGIAVDHLRLRQLQPG